MVTRETLGEQCGNTEDIGRTLGGNGRVMWYTLGQRSKLNKKEILGTMGQHDNTKDNERTLGKGE